jgi:hypothetical protein
MIVFHFKNAFDQRKFWWIMFNKTKVFYSHSQDTIGNGNGIQNA